MDQIKFARRNKYHSYYEPSNEVQSTPSRLTNFNNQEMTFRDLVVSFMGDLIESAIEAGAHSIAGGNIVFMHYRGNEEDDLGRLLVIMVDKKSGFNFNSKLIPEGSEHINLDALRQAALFDLSLFDQIYPEKPDRETYLKFIKGNSKGEFFQKSFGCITRSDNKRSVEQLYDAIDQFQIINDLTDEFYDKAYDAVTSLLEKAARKKEPISARKLYQTIEAQLPAGSDLKGTFESFVNVNGFEVNDHIEPTKQTVEQEKWVDIDAKDASFKAKVYKKKIGAVGSGEVVEYDVENNKLILDISNARQREALEKLVANNE